MHQTLNSVLSTITTKTRCQRLRTINLKRLPLPLNSFVFYMDYCSCYLYQMKSTLIINISSTIFAFVGVILFLCDLNINGYYYQDYWMVVSVLPLAT
jgi:hypothetical protein